MNAYLEIVNNILDKGVLKDNRTGIKAYTIPGVMFEHDMKNGFPLLTTKRMPFKLISSELEFFIKGKTDKQWLIDNNNHIWDEWCTPSKVPYAHDDKTKKAMKNECDLGPIYGFQWRNFGGEYKGIDQAVNNGVDQFKKMIDTLKNDPDSRRMLVSAWNPQFLNQMALPPCHYSFQVTVINRSLNLLWNQRSVDVALGLPFNIASYALLLHLLAKEVGLEEGKLVGFLADTHIYTNHIEGIKLQLTSTVFAARADQ